MIRLNRTTGFTLLELVCALAVLAILATLGAPLAGRFRDRAHGLRCSANLKGLGAAAAAYMTDHNVCWPQIASGTSPSSTAGRQSGESQNAAPWIAALAPYGVAEKTWRCPTIEAKIATHGKSEALKMKRLDYVPTQFGSQPGSARLWPTHPWFIERSPNHGLGPKILLTNGRVVSMEDLLKELPVQ